MIFGKSGNVARRWPLALAILIAGAAQAGPLPIRPGVFVLTDTDCHDAPFAAMFEYDGRSISAPHEARCASRLVRRQGSDYRVSTTCRALGDGTPTKATTWVDRYRVLSATRVVRSTGDGAALRYRWCGAKPD